MIHILIAGSNSYVGTSFETFLKKWPDKYFVDTLDVRNNRWLEVDFSKFDVVLDVAGIVHKKETKENRDLFYKINRDLSFEIALKCKESGVKQFIFLSSMSVYGMDIGTITKQTCPKPKSHYGISKLEAEGIIKKLENFSFKVAILRPPMIYGDGCKGNYNYIQKIVLNFPVFPRINNKRSILRIDHLCNFLKIIVDDNLSGCFFPQDSHYGNTTNLAIDISKKAHKRIYCSKILGLAVLCFMPFSKKVRKAFGNLIYKDTEDFDFIYSID